jgi:hypothetical protein
VSRRQVEGDKHRQDDAGVEGSKGSRRSSFLKGRHDLYRPLSADKEMVIQRPDPLMRSEEDDDA